MGDVERLAADLRAAGVEVGYVGGERFREFVAVRLLRAGWSQEAHNRPLSDERAESGPLGVERVVEDVDGEWEK